MALTENGEIAMEKGIGPSSVTTAELSGKVNRPRKSSAERLQELDQRMKALLAEKQDLQARQREEQRRKETREKIIVGGAVLAHADIDPEWRSALHRTLARAVQRPKDRDDLADLLAWLEKPIEAGGSSPKPARPAAPLAPPRQPDSP